MIGSFRSRDIFSLFLGFWIHIELSQLLNTVSRPAEDFYDRRNIFSDHKSPNAVFVTTGRNIYIPSELKAYVRYFLKFKI